MLTLCLDWFLGLIPVFCRNISFVYTIFSMLFFTLLLYFVQTLIRIVFSQYKSFYLNW